MRTTLDLPAPLLKRLKQRAKREGVPMKTIYNRALARTLGLGCTEPQPVKAPPAKTRN